MSSLQSLFISFFFFFFFVRIISLHAEMLIMEVVELAVVSPECFFFLFFFCFSFLVFKGRFSGSLPSLVNDTPYTQSRGDWPA